MELPSSVRREVEVGSGGDRTGRSGNSNAHYEKRKGDRADEVRLEMMEMAGEEGY